MDVRVKIIRFGVFELDVEARELRKNGIKVRLQDQPFQILTVLLDRRGEIVPRDELRAQLWPDGTFVDFDHSLNASINKLRDALGDSASNARFVETIPRRGYRFIAPVEYVEPVGMAETAAAPRVERSRRTNLIAVAAGIVLTVVSALVAIRLAVNTAAESGEDVEISPLTSGPGIEIQPSFSPDGNHVAYVHFSRGFGEAAVYVKQIGSESARRVSSGQEAEVSPKWSPDGRTIAFVRVLGRGERAEAVVVTVPALGGAERPVPHGQITTRFGGNLMGLLLDWCADSEHLVISDQGQGETAALFVINFRTGERSQVTTPRSGIGDADPSVSPDGARVIFTRYGGTPPSSNLYVLNWDARFRPASEVMMQSAGPSSRKAAWMPNGREILFASGPYHRKRLMRLELDSDSRPRPVPFAAEGAVALTVAISRQSRMVYPKFHADTDIHRVALTPQGTTSGTHAILRSTFIDHLPDYSPDGKQIAFVSNRSGVQEIWISKADGSEPRQLTHFRGNPEATWPRWSPDGNWLAASGGGKAFIVDTQSGQARAVRQEAFVDHSLDWSGDGKWLYVTSDRTGRDEIWKVASQPGRAADTDVRITRHGGSGPRVSLDGRFVYYTKGTVPAELWRVPADGGLEERVVAKLANNGAFTIATAGVFFIPPLDATAKTSVMLFEPGRGSPRSIAPVDGEPMWGMTMSPDGRSLLYVSMKSASSDLMLVNNFR